MNLIHPTKQFISSLKTCKFTRKDIHIYVCPAFASSHCIESSISSHLQFDLYIQQYNDLEGNYFREIAEEGFLWEAETCMWRRVLMRTMRTWSTTWRTTSTGRGWPPARLTRRLRCGTSRTAGSGCALLGVTFQYSLYLIIISVIIKAHGQKGS